MIINEILLEDPEIGDQIDLELGDLVVETYIADITEDGIVIGLDEAAIALVLEAGRSRLDEAEMDEAKYHGREVPLGKPMKGDVKKSKVYVKGPKGNVVKVNFGAKGMRIKKNNPKRRKSFRARHKCENPGPRWKAKYWSCRAW